MRGALVAAVVLATATCVYADLQPLQVLKQTDTEVTIGNAAFSVVVKNSGRLQNIQARGTEYVSFVALYTNPTASRADETIRVVQGETGERRGIGPTPDRIVAQRRENHYFIALEQTASRPDSCYGAPLYDLHQEIEVAPNGVVRVRYQFDWRRFFRLNRATIYLGLTGSTFANLPFWADYTTHCNHGFFSALKQYETFEGLNGHLRALVVDCPSGPFHFWLDTNTTVTGSYWGESCSAIGVQVPETASGQPMYSGATSVVEFTVKMPLA